MDRPWVQPEQVRDYTSSSKVKERSDDQLSFDIARAELYVIAYTHNKFADADVLPSDVMMAVILLADAYAKQAIVQKDGIMSSETFDDYSYTIKSDADVTASLDLGAMLDGYVLAPSGGKVTMKLRKL
jgi:hypothetical protein